MAIRKVSTKEETTKFICGATVRKEICRLSAGEALNTTSAEMQPKIQSLRNQFIVLCCMCNRDQQFVNNELCMRTFKLYYQVNLPEQ
jgi:hypothetical protein